MESGRPLLKDRYNLVFFILLLHGLGNLTPWNVFVNALDYFANYKLAPSNRTIGGVEYRKLFLQNLTTCSMIPLVLFNWLNAFVQFSEKDSTRRIVSCISVEIFVLLLTIVLAMVDTSNLRCIFFALTMLSVIVLNAANGVYTNVVFGIAAKFPPRYFGGVILGNNVSGTFVSTMAIVFRLIQPSLQKSAIYYFIVALAVLMICLDTYLVLPLIKFYRIHEYLNKSRVGEARTFQYLHLVKIPFRKLLGKAFFQLANVFLVYFVTLSLFPAVQANIGPHSEDFFLQDMFRLVVCFFSFNFFTMIGSIVAHFIQWPSPSFAVIPIALRLLYIPFYMLCNYRVTGIERTTPIYVTSDWAFWMVSITFAFTSGYFSSLAMQYVPKTVDPQYREDIGRFASAILLTAAFSGLLSSYLWPALTAAFD